MAIRDPSSVTESFINSSLQKRATTELLNDIDSVGTLEH